MILIAGCALVTAAVATAAVPETPASTQALGAQERAAVARVRALETLRGFLPWRDFDPTEYPSVIFARGEWALAFGFDAPPEGFVVLPDLTVAGRPVARHASGGFSPPPWSPAMVGGRWAVISEAPPPAAAPAGSHPGAEASETVMARMVSDAFALHLMRQRGAATPQAPIPVGYPDSAEVIALTDLQRRVLLELLDVRQLNEVTIPEHRRLARQAIAVYEERARAIGPELAAGEREVERWMGLRADAGVVIHKLAMQRSFRPKDLFKADPGFNDAILSGLQRALLLSYPQSFAADGPSMSMAQIAARVCAFGFATERFDGAWRIRAVEDDRSLPDLLLASLGEPQEGESTSTPDLLARAKEAFGYDMLLETGRETLERLAAEREAFLAHLGGPKVIIRLNELPVSELLEDAASARQLGGGSLLHEKGLRVRAPGLELDYAAPVAGGGAGVITRSSHRSDRIAEIALIPAVGAPLPLFEGQGTARLQAEGLKIQITGGRVSKGAGGETIIDLGSPREGNSRGH